jgi:hypothetical protein
MTHVGSGSWTLVTMLTVVTVLLRL